MLWNGDIKDFCKEKKKREKKVIYIHQEIWKLP